MMKTAGQEGAKNSVVHHVGRTTGNEYQTPVMAVATSDGYLVSLPYGQRADWVKNVLAAGSATLVTDGSAIPVERPEVVPTTDVLDDLPPNEQRVLRLCKVEESLVLHPAHLSASMN